MQYLIFLAAEIALAIVIALIIRFGFRLFTVVKGSSMRETLLNGDVLLTRRKRKKREIRRFEIVICRFPKRKGCFVKRVIGLPGERIRIEKDVVYVNDAPLDEDFPRRHCMRGFAEITVPEGCYFLLGDNRPNSKDSRSVGCIPEKDLLATAEYILFSLGRYRKLQRS